jgi:anti-sigma factor ChrR (cupin superfamily)
MTDDERGTDRSELTALYAAGALTSQESEAFESQLDANDAEAADATAALHSFGAVVQSLADALPPATPSAAVRARLLARIAAEPDAAAAPGHPTPAPARKRAERRRRSPDWYIQRDSADAWEESRFPGVQVRKLFVDFARKEYTALVRMAPGCRYPAHVHNGTEECIVLSGDLRSGDEVLHAWDYQRAAPSTRHAALTTQDGCLLLIRASLTDEVIEREHDGA